MPCLKKGICSHDGQEVHAGYRHVQLAYADIRAVLERQGEPIGEMDMMIAASALSGGYVLVTNNTRHFRRVPGLTIENWTGGSKT